MTDCVLGVDAGGTKTLAVVASKDGLILGVGKSGGSNFQSCGQEEAGRQLDLAIRQAMATSGISHNDLLGACYGVSGADRDEDFDTVRRILKPISPCSEFNLVNDTIVALRAGTDDGVGIALIAGTGANAIGRNSKGITLAVGGMGALTGDYGSAGQLAEAAIVAAFKGLDGRANPTVLSEMFCKHLGLSKLEDIIEYEFFDLPRGSLDLGSLAPLVFEAARQGDEVARNVLRHAGMEIGLAAMVIIDRLFEDTQPVDVVFGGSVFAKGSSPILRNTVERFINSRHENVNFIKLLDEPVLGAIAFAFEHQGWTCSKHTMDILGASFKSYMDCHPKKG